MVPSQGRRLPTMRLRSVDLPAPFAPRMAIRESMLHRCHTGEKLKRLKFKLTRYQRKVFHIGNLLSCLNTRKRRCRTQ